MADWMHKRGMTLIEILVVVAVIATLAGMVLVLTLRVENQSSEATVANAFALLRSALREYYEFMGKFPDEPVSAAEKAADPTSIRTMYAALDSVPASRQVLKGIDSILVPRHENQEARLYDPWGTMWKYAYVPTQDSCPELTSAGPDKQFGTADDIRSRGK